jgi:hypothetical protein
MESKEIELSYRRSSVFVVRPGGKCGSDPADAGRAQVHVLVRGTLRKLATDERRSTRMESKEIELSYPCSSVFIRGYVAFFVL